MEDKDKKNEFPTNAFLHKDVLGVLDFIEETGCRGEGVTVAVIDTGVDPGAYGMRKTLDGRPKVVDILDLTGDGDVEMGPEKECEFEGSVDEREGETRAVRPTHNGAKSHVPEGNQGKNDKKETKEADEKGKVKQSHEGMGYIVGVSGRKLWFSDRIRKMCPSGKFRIGAKSAWSFWPEDVIQRCREKRVERWTLGWEATYGATQRAVREMKNSIGKDKDARSGKEEQNSKENFQEGTSNGPTVETTKQQSDSIEVSSSKEEDGKLIGKDQQITKNRQQDSEEEGKKKKEDRTKILEQWEKKIQQQLLKRELENRLEMLEYLQKQYDDPGPIFDCVTFHNGKTWKAIVDTTETGNLDEASILGNYREDHEYASFRDYDQLNHSVNIYDEGRLLSIVVPTGDHGTGVAGHVGAYHPGQGEFDGMAPNCQIVSLKVKDSRIGIATGAIVRALACITPSKEDDNVDHVRYHQVKGIDIVNYSIGGPAGKAEHGRMVQMIRELVRKHDIVFVTSAGNDGPALSTVRAPSAVNEDVVSVGAYMTKDLATQIYPPSSGILDYFKYLDSTKETEETSPPKATDGFAKHDNDGTKSGANLSPSHLSKESIDERLMTSVKKRQAVKAIVWTSSSRGPSVHGLPGISISAPGAGYSPAPEWRLSTKAAGNGTSLASPSCAGALAVFISYLRSKSISYNSYFLRRVIENSAKRLISSHFGPDNVSSNQMKNIYCFDRANSEHSTGNGSMDIISAKHYVEDVIASPLRLNCRGESVQSREDDGNENGNLGLHLELLRIAVDVLIHPSDGNAKWTKGIYIRSASLQSNQKSSYVQARVYLQVHYDKEDSTVKERDILTKLELRISLRSTAKWVTCPPTVLLMGGGEYFTVAVDVNAVPHGAVNYGEIIGSMYSATGKPGRCLFKVPVTVICGERDVVPIRALELYPGMILRKFLSPPFGATYCSIWIKTAADFSCQPPLIEGRNITLHCVQCKDIEIPIKGSDDYYKKDFEIQPDNVYTRIFPIIGGKLLEVCIAQEWNEFGKTVLESINFTFGGLSVSSPHISITEPGKAKRLTIRNAMSRAPAGRDQRNMNVVGKFTKIRKDKAPLKSYIEPLGLRDQLPKGHQTYSLKLEYSINIEVDGTVSFCNSGLRILFDSMLCTGSMALFNDDKKLIEAAEGETLFCSLLKAGNYTLVCDIRDDDCEVLKRLKGMVLSVNFELKEEIEAAMYSSEENAILQNKQDDYFEWTYLEYDDEGNVWFGSEAAIEVQKSHPWVEAGDTLLGYFEVDSWPSASRKGVSYTDLPRYDLSCAIRETYVPRSDGSSKDSSACSEDEESSAEQQKPVVEALQENMEKTQIDYLDTLIDRKSWSDFDEAYKTFSVDKMDPEKKFHLNLLLRKLRRHALEASSLDTILDTAEDILKLESQASKIAGSIELYPRFDGNSDSKKAHEKYVMQRDAIIEAHFRRIKALLSLGFDSHTSDSKSSLGVSSKDKDDTMPSETQLEKGATEMLDKSSQLDPLERNSCRLDQFWIALRRWVHVRRLGSSERTRHGVSGKEWKELLLEREIMRKRYSTALKYIKEAEDKEATEMRLKLLDKLGWTFEKEWEVRRKFVRFPKKRVQF